MSARRPVRNLEALLDAGIPSTLFGRPVVLENDRLGDEMKRLATRRIALDPRETEMEELDSGAIETIAKREFAHTMLAFLYAVPVKPVGVLKTKTSPLKIYRPEAN